MFLPISKEDLKERRCAQLDIILVSGDAYVDHPAYAASVIGRVLEDAGFAVGIISQPNWQNKDCFSELGRPKLFFGVTAGNLDSMVANYTANKKVRNNDDYSPGGRAGLRPDRATIVYANRIKEAFPNIPVVMGGLEASLRRFTHYDHWSDKVRHSVLLDSKADILVYGMGEGQVIEIARRMKGGEGIKMLDDIRGTVIVRNDLSGFKNYLTIPSFEEASSDQHKFNESFKTIYAEADPFRGRTLIQKDGERFVIQSPPARPLSTEELDRIYELNYLRSWHPLYDKDGGVPGFETVKFSVISHRGCFGGCNFCSLYLHQGRIIQSRSETSMVKEIRTLAQREDFRGTITDLGGPTANMYKAGCSNWKGIGACRDKNCLMPEKCQSLKLGYGETLKLWEMVRKIPKVKHLFIASGLRYDLLTEKYSDAYLEALCRHHISGQLKVAPEHSVEAVLKLMNKPSFKVYQEFIKRFEAMNKVVGKKQYLVNYFISSHPGTTWQDARQLADWLKKRHIHPEQIQDYLPLPMTISACMYYTEKDPFTGKKLQVAKKISERKAQRAFIQPP